MRFYSTGNFQREIGDHFSINQTSVSRIIHDVSKRICQLRTIYIKFPSNEEIRTVKQNFFAISRFPGVVGTIDGTHIPILKPSGDDYEEYRCRKGFFSINVQAVSSSNLQFFNIVSRWKGSTHDARIWQNSSQCYRFNKNLEYYWETTVMDVRIIY